MNGVLTLFFIFLSIYVSIILGPRTCRRGVLFFFMRRGPLLLTHDKSNVSGGFM